jgi:hypothetical protein
MIRNDTILCDSGSIMAYNGFGLGEGGNLHHKCLCGEPNFD